MKNVLSPQARVFVYVRKRLKLSQHKLSKKLHINQSTLCRIEADLVQAQSKHFRGLERLTGLSLTELIKAALASVAPSFEMGAVREERVSLEALSREDRDLLRSLTYMEVYRIKKQLAQKRNALETVLDQQLLHEATVAALQHKVRMQRKLAAFAQQNNLGEAAVRLCQQDLDQCERELGATEGKWHHHSAAELKALHLELDGLEAVLALKEETMQRLKALEKSPMAQGAKPTGPEDSGNCPPQAEGVEMLEVVEAPATAPELLNASDSRLPRLAEPAVAREPTGMGHSGSGLNAGADEGKVIQLVNPDELDWGPVAVGFV